MTIFLSLFAGIISIVSSPNLLAVAPKVVVATVNGEAITRGEFDNYFEEALLFVSKRKLTREKALLDLVNRKLGIQRAKKKNLQNDPEVKSKMEDVLYHSLISQELEGEVQKIQVSEKDVSRYYSDNKEYRTAHILFRLPAKFNQEELQTVYDRAMKVYQEVKQKPEKFAVLANQVGQSSVATVGGDLGYQPPTSYPPEFYEAIRGKKIGTITEPIQTQYGFHIIKIVGIKKFEEINLELYKSIIKAEKRDQIMEAYFQKHRGQADISLKKKLIK